MSSIVQLKRSALSGKVPGTGSLNLGELALNTYDGKIFFRRSGSTDTIQEVVTTNVLNTGSVTITGTLTAESIVGSISASNGIVSGSSQITLSSGIGYSTLATTGSNQFTGSQNITGSLRATLTGSFGSLKVNDTLTINHGEAIISGSALVTNDLTILGQVNARQFNISVISSSVLFESGSSRFGNTLDDTHDFTGSVNVTGSLYLNGVAVGASSNSGSFTGSFSGDGSGLRGVVSDDIPRDGWDYDSNSSASISDFNSVSDKYFIDFEQSQSTAVGTPVGFKGFMTNVSGSTQILPTLDSIDFIVRDNLVASIGIGGIVATAPAGTVSGSSQLTSSYDTRYVLSGSITQTTWDNIASKPSGIISGSSQLTSSMLATTGSNTFVGTQTLSGSIIPAIDNTYDLGSATYQWRDIYVSSGSLYIDGTKVLGSTGNELQITTDVGQSIKILEAGSDSIILQSADGDIQLKTSGGGNLLFDPTTGLIDVRGTLQIQDGNKITSSGGNGIVFGNNIVVSGSLESTGNINGINLTTLSSSIATQISTIQTNTGSSNIRLSNLESKSASVDISITNINSFTASNGNTSLNNLTGSLATTGSNTFFGTQTFSGSVYIANDLIVQGSSSIQYISASSVSIGTNIVQLNTANPSVRFAGLTIIDSGSVGGSGSFLYDSVQDEFIFVHRGNGTNVTSSHFVLGPETYDSLGSETYLTNNRLPKGTGKEHLNDSNITDTGTLITLGSNTTITGILTATGFSGSLASTNGVVSGSSQITYANISSIPSGIVSGSTQTIANLPTGTVSGSSQINVMSTTNIARLATTGSNIFIGNQTISGSIDVNQKQNGTSNFYFRNSDTTDTNSRVYVNVISGDRTLQIKAINGDHTYITPSTSCDMYLGYNNALKITSAGVVAPTTNGTQDLGSSSLRWSTIYTSDLSLNNGIGDWTIVEGEDDLFLYNNKKGKVYKFALTEVDPNVATPKKS